MVVAVDAAVVVVVVDVESKADIVLMAVFPALPPASTMAASESLVTVAPRLCVLTANAAD